MSATLNIEGNTHFALGWKESVWGEDFQKLRSRKARELRKEGYTVTTRTLDFSDLASDRSAILEAHLPGTPKEAFGVPTYYMRKD